MSTFVAAAHFQAGFSLINRNHLLSAISVKSFFDVAKGYTFS